MRWRRLPLLAVLFPVAASAQPAPTQPPVYQPPVTQPPVYQPPVYQAPLIPPPVTETPLAPLVPPSTPPAPAAPASPGPWLARDTATLQALDKVNAQSAPLTVKVGQSAQFGSLAITVRACVVRPPDMPADAAAFLDVADSRPDSPAFSGWLLRSAPAVSMMEHPIYDLRLVGCGP